jgi:chemotaxis protein MotA
MSTLLIGFSLLCLIIGLSFESGNAAVYLQVHSILLVVGGTLAILLFSTTIGVLQSTWRSTVSLFKPENRFSNHVAELMGLLEDRNKVLETTNPLIQYAMELWGQGVDPELFIVLISQRRKEIESRTTDAVHALKNLSKYPPALGMTGTVMGMVTLFSNLDNNKSNIGSSLSMAMTATFLGLIVTNLIVSPLADRLHVKQVNEQRLHESIYEVLLLINRGEAASLIREEVNDRAS